MTGCDEEKDCVLIYDCNWEDVIAIGWTTDLQGTFDKIASYLKKDGIFIFSWHHTLNYCVAWSCDERKDVFEDEKLVMMKSYHDESYFKMPAHDSEIILCKLDITFMTAHASKGLGYDNVIVINGRNETYGFPSKIEDDPVLSLVIKEDKSMQYAEERRLFYVAMTRTKNRVYFIAPEENPSEFLLEIKREYKNVFLHGKWSEEEPARMGKKKCPVCGFPLQLKYKSSYGLKLYICTNEPEICSFMSNNLSGGKMSIMKCQACRDGYLIVKYSEKGGYFLGCSDYKRNSTGCNCTISMRDYYKMMGYVCSESMGHDIVERAKTYYGKMSETKAAERVASRVTESDRKKNWEQEMMNQGNAHEVEVSKFLIYKDYNMFQMVETVLRALVHISDSHYFGVTLLAAVLRGSETEKIAKHNLKAVAEYGSLASLSEDEVTTVIYWLIEKEYILQTNGQYPVLHITNKGLTYKEYLTPQNTRSLVNRLGGA